MQRCPCCHYPLGNTRGESGIYGSDDVPDLCEPCWLAEDALIDQEGTNSPEWSDVIKERLAYYRRPLKPKFLRKADVR
jgi:hypothetical protein